MTWRAHGMQLELAGRGRGINQRVDLRPHAAYAPVMPSPPSLSVTVTVTLGARTLPIEQVRDARIASALSTAGREIGAKLAKIACSEHGRTASNVRIHFDARGNADLRYDSCCDALGKKIAASSR